MQLMIEVQKIVKDLGLFLFPYDVIATSHSAGFIEFIPDSISLDGLKRKFPKQWNLRRYYELHFGNDLFEEA